MFFGIFSVAAGCGQQDTGDAVSGLRVNAPLESPAWDSQEGSLFALRQADRSLVTVDVTPGGIAQGNQAGSVSEELAGLGENIAPDLRESGVLYVPRPESNQVTVVGAEDLRNINSFEAGPSPSRVALTGPTTANSGIGDTLLALSKDDASVTGVSLDSYTQRFQEEIDVGTGALLATTETGGGRSFWAAGSEGVTFYDGSNLSSLPQDSNLDVGALATDSEVEGLAFVGESSSGRLNAVSVDPAGGLRVVDEVDLGSDAEQLAMNEGLLYAATSEALIALEPQSLEIVYRAEFGEPMREAVSGRAVPSGITFSEDNAYLTLEGEPYIVEVGKRQ
jgi:hypothetical protein